MGAQPRLCKVAVQRDLGLAVLQEYLDQLKVCTCTTAGLVGPWSHYMICDASVAWAASLCLAGVVVCANAFP